MGVLPVRGQTTQTVNRNNPYVIIDVQGFEPEQYAGIGEYEVTIAIPNNDGSAVLPGSEITFKKISLYEGRDGSRGISFYTHKVFEKDEDGQYVKDPETGKTKRPKQEYTVSLPDGIRNAIKDVVLAHYAACEAGEDPNDIQVSQSYNNDNNNELYDDEGNVITDPF